VCVSHLSPACYMPHPLHPPPIRSP
jgi:hypothetical protein